VAWGLGLIIAVFMAICWCASTAIDVNARVRPILFFIATLAMGFALGKWAI
jgi:hypothetical protein